MYLKQKKCKNKDIYLAIIEKYNDPEKGARERTVQSIGYLSKLKEEYDDPITHFTEYAKKLTKESKESKTEGIKIDLTKKLTTDVNDSYNVGYGILKSIYKELQLDKFWASKVKESHVDYSVDKLFRLLTFTQAMNPNRVLISPEYSDYFFEPIEIPTSVDLTKILHIIYARRIELSDWIIERCTFLYDINVRSVIRNAGKGFNRYTPIPVENLLPDDSIGKNLFYVKSTECIGAYRAICYTSDVLMYVLEHKLEYQFRTDDIISSIKKYNCTHLDTNLWQFTYFDEILKACVDKIELFSDKKYMTQQEIQRFLRY
ncbi:MAG: hypothetical protein K5644_09320 [Lachnospiraceae bacterium]|nr:hypothetical protein [Lachnospiraceae bacterium]